MDPDGGAGAHRRHRLALREDLDVGPDPDLEVLRPETARLEHRLEPRGLGRARLHLGQVDADLGDERAPHLVGLLGRPARLLLDDSLDETLGEGDAGRLHRLEVDGGEEADLAERAEARPLGRADERGGVVLFE